MHADYYLWIEGEESGPISWAELKRRYKTGELTKAVQVRNDDASSWEPIYEEVHRRMSSEAEALAMLQIAVRSGTLGVVLTDDHRGIKDPGAAIQFWGAALLLGGIAAFIGAALMDTAAPTGYALRQVENLGQLNVRTCLCIFAASLFLGGCTLIAAGHVTRPRQTT